MNIQKLFDSVPYNSSKRFNCPLCLGINTLTITKEQGQVKYNCFKAKCPLKGGKHVRMSNEEGRRMYASKTQLEARTEVNATFAIPSYWVQGLASKKCFQMLLNYNALESYNLGLFKVGYDPRQNRLLYFIQNRNGNIIGAVGRALGYETPKVYNYPTDYKLPFNCGTGNTAVLVEDCASACSIGRFPAYTGIALLGTQLSNDYLFYIISNYEHVIIALDRDATYKALKIKKFLDYYVKDVLIWKLNKDFKNMNTDEMYEYIKNNKKQVII